MAKNIITIGLLCSILCIGLLSCSDPGPLLVNDAPSELSLYSVRVCGTVTEGGDPVENAEVYICIWTETPDGPYDGFWWPYTAVRTNQYGFYEEDEVPCSPLGSLYSIVCLYVRSQSKVGYPGEEVIIDLDIS